MKIERICPTEETRCFCATRTKEKKKKWEKRLEPAFYLQNRSSVVENDRRRFDRREKAPHVRSSFLSNFYRARDVRSVRNTWHVSNIVGCRCTARHRSGVNTLTVAIESAHCIPFLWHLQHFYTRPLYTLSCAH